MVRTPSPARSTSTGRQRDVRDLGRGLDGLEGRLAVVDAVVVTELEHAVGPDGGLAVAGELQRTGDAVEVDVGVAAVDDGDAVGVGRALLAPGRHVDDLGGVGAAVVTGDLGGQGDDDHRVVGLGAVVEVDQVGVLLEHAVLEGLDLGRGLGERGRAPPAGEGAAGLSPPPSSVVSRCRRRRCRHRCRRRHRTRQPRGRTRTAGRTACMSTLFCRMDGCPFVRGREVGARGSEADGGIVGPGSRACPSPRAPSHRVHRERPTPSAPGDGDVDGVHVGKVTWATSRWSRSVRGPPGRRRRAGRPRARRPSGRSRRPTGGGAPSASPSRSTASTSSVGRHGVDRSVTAQWYTTPSNTDRARILTAGLGRPGAGSAVGGRMGPSWQGERPPAPGPRDQTTPTTRLRSLATRRSWPTASTPTCRGGSSGWWASGSRPGAGGDRG